MASAVVQRRSSVYKTNWNKFEDGVEVGRKVMVVAFQWLYEYERLKSKPQGDNTPIEYVGEYLETLSKGKKAPDSESKAQLKDKVPPEDLDISLLYILFRFTCGLLAADDPAWSDGSDKDSLEHTLFLVKKERNVIGHERHKAKATNMSDLELKDRLDNLQLLYTRIIYKAGQKVCKDCSEITKQTDEINEKLTEILGVNAERFVQKARQEKEKHNEQGMEVREKVYVTPLIRNPNHSSKGDVLTLKELFECNTDDDFTPDLILVTGDAGAGKTTLCRYLDRLWVKKKEEMQKFDLVLIISYIDLDTSDLLQTLIQDLLPETTSWCDPYKILDILSQMNVLWILDGVEDSTRDTVMLMNKLLQRQDNNNYTILMTTRPEQAHTLSKKYSHKNILTIKLDGADPMEMLETFVTSDDSNTFGPEIVNKLKQKFKGTQQYFMAALYIDSQIKISTDVKQDLNRLFVISSEQKIINFWNKRSFEVLVQLMTLLGDNIDQQTTEAIVEVLDCIMSKGYKSYKFFDIIHTVSSNLTMLKLIAKVTPKHWFVINSHIEDALILLQYSSPQIISLRLDSNVEKELKLRLLKLLQKLTTFSDPVEVDLFLTCPNMVSNNLDTLDPYLEVLGEENSQCVIVSLGGHITESNYGLLEKCMISDYCETLTLDVRRLQKLTTASKIAHSFFESREAKEVKKKGKKKKKVELRE
ncbi:hypothetical protein Pcinc_021880 [Petrolisthes cinctipes]|uniref:NACHT domain-containing protein n=1 Tax=Petrolisthes cinctipes TaxID=88211 RepID=A0AAE1KEF9_PETCI|nr:hypothetical protein Pcinc_021880 [Petrolisthes cinctipes]